MANERGRELVAVAAALAAHALLLALHRVAPPGLDLSAPLANVELPADTFDIETTPPASPAPAAEAEAEPDEGDDSDEAEEPEPPGAAQAKVAPPKSSLEPSPPTAEPPSAPVPAPGGETPTPAPAPGNTAGDEYGPAPGAPVVGLPPGVNAPIWSIPGVLPNAGGPKPAPTAVDAPRPVDKNIAEQVLAGTLHSKDKAVGIDIPGAGVVATSVADAVRTSSIRDARATFEIKLAADGTVQGVRMVSASGGDATTWASVVNAAKNSLSAKTLQMGPDGKGATVTVKVESKIQYPAGSKEKYKVEPVCANEIIQMIEDAVQNGSVAGMVGTRGVRTDSGRFIPYNEMTEEERSRFCIPLPAIRVSGDLSNIGAHTTNFVSSSFQVKRDGEKALPADASLPLETRAPWLPVRDGKVRAPPPPKKKKKKKAR